MSTHQWQFRSRFRRHAFGWRSNTPLARIKEAVAEIKKVARTEGALAAEGAVMLLEKLSPALEHVDSSSGALGSAVNRAIDALVPIIAKADVESEVRARWLARLWEALQNDEMPYIEVLGDYWGELCVTPELARVWVDELQPVVEQAWCPRSTGHDFFKGTSACLAALFAAGCYAQLLALIERAPFKWWHYRRWGVKALAAMGQKAEAIRYADELRGVNDPAWQIAEACEAILLSSGLAEEAYQRYAVEANQGATHHATFRAIAKKYPDKSAIDILRDLVASSPGAEGKWFAAAKDAGLFELALELVSTSPADPRTLARAARDYAEERPVFAIGVGLAALRWISLGYGYEVSSTDVLDAYSAVMRAVTHQPDCDEQEIKTKIQALIAGSSSNSFLKSTLAHHLSI